MEIAEFQRVLNLGLGRAILHLQKHPASRSLYRDAILYACLNNTAYDPQTDNKTMHYVMDAIELTGTPEYFRTPILEALKSSPAKDSALSWQLFELAVCFAKQGDEEMRAAIREKFAANAAAGSFTGDYRLIELDGLDGLLFVAHHLGGKKLGSGWDYIPHSRVKHAEELFGSEITWQRLNEAAAKSGRVKAFVERVQQEEARRDPELKSRREKAKQIAGLNQPRRDTLNYDKIVEAIRNATPYELLPMNYSQWVKTATDEEIKQLAEGFLQEENPYSLLCYLEIFGHRPFPLDLSKLMLLVENGDDRVSYDRIANRAIRALELVTHPDIRALAFRMIQNGNRLGWAVGLLENNFEDGDWQFIEQLTQEKLPPFSYHSLGFSIRAIFAAHPSEAAVGAMLNQYEYGPCSSCRERFVDLLRRINKMPDWMLEECQYDANPKLRAKARRGFVDVEEQN